MALELAFIVRAAARVVPDSTCLRRALVLRDLLGRVGIPATVQLGVRPAAEDAGVAFHAWVEAEGVVVSEPPRPVADYVVLASELPPPGMAP